MLQCGNSLALEQARWVYSRLNSKNAA